MSARTKPASRKEPSSIEGSDSAKQGNPIENLFLSIPTDEGKRRRLPKLLLCTCIETSHAHSFAADLRRAYFWETRRLGEKEREKFVSGLCLIVSITIYSPCAILTALHFSLSQGNCKATITPRKVVESNMARCTRTEREKGRACGFPNLSESLELGTSVWLN